MTLRAVERFVPRVIEWKVPRCPLATRYAEIRAQTTDIRWRSIVALDARACLGTAVMARIALRLRDTAEVTVVCGQLMTFRAAKIRVFCVARYARVAAHTVDGTVGRMLKADGPRLYAQRWRSLRRRRPRVGSRR